MYNNFIIRRRQNKILYTEFLILAVIVGFLSIRYYKVHPAIGFLSAIFSMRLFLALFFANKMFRYLFSITFSLAWSALAFLLGQLIDANSDITAWVFTVLAFFVSLEAHKNHFDFLKKAKTHEYEIQ